MALTLQVVPDKALVIRRERAIVSASWFGPFVQRPYVFPFLGPGNRELTRLGHPEDPVSHSHHRSIWIGHNDVGGVDFWGEVPRSGRIVQKGIEDVRAEGDQVGAALVTSWQDAGGKELLRERRHLQFEDLGRGELALEIRTELRAAEEPVVLGRTNFGLLGIRVARTLRVHERIGGAILNSEEGENEEECFGQHAVWCDYSGPVPVAGKDSGARAAGAGTSLESAIVGIACFDHPRNGAGEVMWHVRNDGWMGPSLTRTEPRTIGPGAPLRVAYRIEAHAGRPGTARIAERYRRWRSRELQTGSGGGR